MSRKSIVFHGFKPNTYPRMFWVSKHATRTELKRHFDIQVDSTSWLDIYDDEPILGETEYGKCIPVVAKDSGRVGVVVVFDSAKAMTPGHMSHEAVHVADYIYEELGIITQPFTDTNENYAYLVQFIVECFDQVRRNKFED